MSGRFEIVERLKRYFQASAGNYRLHGGGDPDLFKAFAERFLALVRTGGALGCVLPRQLLGGSGAAALRVELFRNWSHPVSRRSCGTGAYGPSPPCFIARG